MYVNPYQNLQNGRWLKANFHAHAGTGPNTCGVHSIDKVVDLYKSANFDILCISNHDLFSDTASYSDDSILMIPGVEYSQNEHMLTIGVDRSLHEYGHQAAIDRTNGMGGFAVICHPHFMKPDFWSMERLNEITGFAGLEIINTLIYRLRGSGMATDVWDRLLSQGRLVYGFGSDDFHAFVDVNRSYNMVYCSDRSYNGVQNAVASGAFCASTGLAPEYLTLDGYKIEVKVRYPTETFIDKFTYRFISEGGKVMSVRNRSRAKYDLNGEKYVRIEAMGENGAMIFFQPVYLNGSFRSG